jgi:actin-like ATPase involved in cell morphogenesis
MLFTISDTGHQRWTVAETFKIEGDFLGSSRFTMLLAKYRLVFGETTEETIEMNIKEVMSSEATTEMILEITGKIAGQGFKDLS